MIINTLKECCYKCDCPDIDVEHSHWIYNSGKAKTDAVIKCNHETVCKYYNQFDWGDLNEV